MGVVYLARDTRLERQVAIKTLPAEMAAQPEQMARFRREALLLASLNHPHIAQIYSLEEQDGQQYLVLEYVQGGSLAQRLKGGRLEIRETLDLCRQICLAIESAHQRGIVHRDLKPANVIVTPEGIVKVLDFGIARIAGQDPQLGQAAPDESEGPSERTLHPEHDDTLTLAGGRGDGSDEEGWAEGTPRYMSPEQLRGRPADARADIWTFGCMLYECLTGERAFDGITVADIVAGVLKADPDWSKLPEATPPNIRDLLERCLEKREAKRLSRIAEARQEIEAALGLKAEAGEVLLGPVSEIPGNIPRRLTSFVGREREIAQITELLGSTSLLTLTGAGGCGKTRLALEIADAKRSDYPDGVWLVELWKLTDGNLVAPATARAIGIREGSGKPVILDVIVRLIGKRVLLILDNCEHLREAAVDLVTALLSRCDTLKILATSREPIGAAGETLYTVPPLDVPAPGAPASAMPMEKCSSVHLFVDRARAVQPQFVLTDSSAPVVAQLCRRLDGIPLAIELAAARLRALSVEEIVGRLDDQFRLLTGGMPSEQRRHQTLRGVIDWSYALLSREEAAFFRALSVFAGGWTLVSAAEVCGADHDEFKVLDLLAHLVDKSMVVAEEASGGERRYRLLEMMMQYAREKLEASGEEADLMERHHQHFLQFAERAEAGLTGPEQSGWLDVLEADHENLLEALDWCRNDERRSAEKLHMVGALWRFWYTHGHYTIGRMALHDALESARTAGPTAAKAKALDGSGVLAWRQGDYSAARVLHGEALEIWRTLGERAGIANSLNWLGNVAYVQRDYAAARALHEESLKIRRELGDERGISSSLINLGNVAYDQGEYTSAWKLHEESLIMKRRLHDKYGIASSLNNLGNVAYDRGETEKAMELHRESLAIKRELGDKWGVAASLVNMGRIAVDGGDQKAARELFEESLSIWLQLGDTMSIAEVLESIGPLAAAAGEPGRGAKLMGSAERLREEVGSPLAPNERVRHERHVSALRAALGEEKLQAAWQEGRACEWKDLAEETLSWLVPA
jgi:non-specific serine/threonine protein kinase